MKFAYYNINGEITGFYTEDVHGKFYLDDAQTIRNPKIPDEVFEITDIAWQDFLNNGDKWKANAARTGLELKPIKSPEDIFLENKAKKIARLTGLLREKNRVEAILARNVNGHLTAAENANTQAALDAIPD